jgi:hypothetical protein
MQVFVNLKSIGKRKPTLEKRPYFLPDSITTLLDLLTSVVEIEVQRYNAKETEAMLLPFLTEAQIEDQATVGKVGFGRIYSDKKANAEKAVSSAVQGFEDGLFRVMINDCEAKELGSSINVNDGDTLTFIRLTFLSGRLW